MNIRNLLQWLHDRIHSYNLFIPDENDYTDEDDEPLTPATVVSHQRYATRLYLPFLIGESTEIIVFLIETSVVSLCRTTETWESLIELINED